MQAPSISRRRALKALGAVALSGVAGQLLLSTRASAALAPGAQGRGLAAFIDVSRTLTARPDLNASLALGLYGAFQKTMPDVDQALAGLQAALATGVLAQDDKTAFTEQQKAEQGLAQAILQGWYLGVVGKAKKAVCVAYAETLSNQAVADVLVPPSYSYGPCGSWQARPEVKNESQA
ncbi:MAG: sugar dehydrogenase complex small subunit [Duganella sp.]